MTNNGFFDIEFRLRELEASGDPLVKLNQTIPWEEFRPRLLQVREKPRKSNAGRAPFDVVLMFKILVLQSLYNLGDDATEFQINDRLSFMRFLGLGLGDKVPDAKTIWDFRDELVKRELVKPLFEDFDAYLRAHGFEARKGQIVDASIVRAPKQRNSREENQTIKDGGKPEGWDENKQRQKDTDARWTQRRGVSFYGYKNHIDVDVEHKLIRDYSVTHAAVHDSQVFMELLDENNSSRDVWADSAYNSSENKQRLAELGWRAHLQRKGVRGKPLSDREAQGNRTRAKIRSRIEHVFGVQAQRAGDLILRSVGLARAAAKIGLRNLAFNLDRYRLLVSGAR